MSSSDASVTVASLQAHLRDTHAATTQLTAAARRHSIAPALLHELHASVAALRRLAAALHPFCAQSPRFATLALAQRALRARVLSVQTRARNARTRKRFAKLLREPAVRGVLEGGAALCVDTHTALAAISDTMPRLPFTASRSVPPPRPAPPHTAVAAAIAPGDPLRVAGPRMIASAVLRCVAAHEIVQARFPDGVYHIAFGPHATVARFTARLAEIVNSTAGVEPAQQIAASPLGVALRIAADWFAHRGCLLVLNDLQLVADFKPDFVTRVARAFPHFAILYAGEDGFQPVGREILFERLDFLSAQGHAIMLDESGFTLDDLVSYDVDREMGYLQMCAHGFPIVMTMAARAIKMLTGSQKRRLCWPVYREVMSECQKKKHKYPMPEFPYFPSYYLATQICVNDYLKRNFPEESRLPFERMARSLAALRVHDWVSIKFVALLWGVSEERCKQIAAVFQHVCFVDLETRDLGGVQVDGLTVHELVHECLYLDAKAHEEGGPRFWHTHVLYRFKNHTQDEYLRRNVCRYLVGAGREEDLLKLVADPRWTLQQLSENSITQLEDDFAIATKVLTKREGIGRSLNNEQFIRGLKLIARAARFAWEYIHTVYRSLAVASQPDELYYQLYGRLYTVESRSTLVRDYLKEIEVAASPAWKKPTEPILLSAGCPIKTTIRCGSTVRCLFVHEALSLVACGCDNGTACIIDLAEEDILLQVLCHETAVTSITMSADGKRFITGSQGGEVRVTNAENGEQISTTVNGYKEPVIHVRAASDEDIVEIQLASGGLASIDLTNIGPPGESRPLPPCVVHVSKDNSGEIIATVEVETEMRGSDDTLGMKVVYEDGFPDGAATTDGEGVTCAAWTPDHKQSVFGLDDYSVVFNKTNTKRSGIALKEHAGNVNCLAITQDGRRFVSGSNDGTSRVWTVEEDDELNTVLLQGHSGPVTSVAVSDDGRNVVTGSEDGTARIWGLRALPRFVEEAQLLDDVD